jgi:hypothetical protein
MKLYLDQLDLEQQGKMIQVLHNLAYYLARQADLVVLAHLADLEHLVNLVDLIHPVIQQALEDQEAQEDQVLRAHLLVV